VQYNITLGIAVAYAMSLPLPTEDYESDPMNYWWMFVFTLPSILLLAQFLLFFFVYRRDTPRWLLNNHQRDAAYRALRMVYTETYAAEYLDTISIIRDQELIIKEEYTKSIEETANKYPSSYAVPNSYGRRLRLGIMIHTLQQWCGVNAIVFYATSIFESLGAGLFTARILTLTVGIVNNLGLFVIVPLIDRFGRKPLCLVGEVGMMVNLVVIGLIAGPLNGSNIAISLTVILIFKAFFTFSLGPIAWIYCGEVLDEKGNSITTVVNWLNVFLVVLLFPYLKAGLGTDNVFYLYSGICLLGFIYLLKEMKETKGLTREQILSRFTPGSK